MDQTFAEKILRIKNGGRKAEAGTIVEVEPVVVLCAVNTFAQSILKFYEIGARKVWNPNKLVVVIDHFVPAESSLTANNDKIIREFVKEQGIRYFYDIHEGIGHQILLEKCHARPGILIVGKTRILPRAAL